MCGRIVDNKSFNYVTLEFQHKTKHNYLRELRTIEKILKFRKQFNKTL